MVTIPDIDEVYAQAVLEQRLAKQIGEDVLSVHLWAAWIWSNHVPVDDEAIDKVRDQSYPGLKESREFNEMRVIKSKPFTELGFDLVK